MAGTLTRPWLAIVLFIVCFVAWYDSTVAGWLLAESNRHTLSLLVLGGTALLLWWHLIGTGPRLHVELSPWLAAIALLVVELASMSIAVPTTFATEPLYPHYVAAFAAEEQRALHLVDDQALGGGLIWVAGSAVYLSSIVLILNRLFHRHKMDGSKPLAGWDADERMIMPGLEHRVGQKGRSRHRP
jgi:cytochrome c oxidase assembly factor CtaG